jgi:hypothetical protein
MSGDRDLSPKRPVGTGGACELLRLTVFVMA